MKNSKENTVVPATVISIDLSVDLNEDDDREEVQRDEELIGDTDDVDDLDEELPEERGTHFPPALLADLKVSLGGRVYVKTERFQPS